MNVKVRAAIRTAAMLGIIAISCALVYAFAVFGMLPGIIVLCALCLVFVIYDTNKSQIEYEDKLDDMVKKCKE